MPSYEFPNPPEDLMDRIKKRLEENQRRKQHRGRQLAIVVAVVLLFAIPASAYNIAREYWGFTSGIKIAIENEEGIKIDKKLRHGDLELTIKNAVWEDDELAITYSMNDRSFRLDEYHLVDENGNEITKAYSSEGGKDGGIVKFKNINIEKVKSDRVWLRILSLEKNELYPPFAAFKRIMTTPEMKKGEFVEINQELEAEQGTYLLRHIRFGSDVIKINFDFTPKNKYRKFYDNEFGPKFLPRLGLNVEGQKYRYHTVGGSMLTKDGPLVGTFYFDAVPMEKINEFQIGVVDSLVLVDWKLPIPVQNKESVSLELAEVIELPEGKLILTGIRHGTKSTGIDFSFKPAQGFEGISSLKFVAYLRSNGKYYNRHGFEYDGHTPGLSGTINFDPVRYDNVEELEFILGEIEYTYDTDAGVTVSQATIPRTIEALGSSFTIDKMEFKNGQTLLHIAYDKENRWFYNADFRIGMPPKASRLTVAQRFEMGLVQLEDGEELKKGLQRLKDNLGDYGVELLKDVDLERNIIGTNLEISDEHEEVEVNLISLSTIHFSGETVKIPVPAEGTVE